MVNCQLSLVILLFPLVHATCYNAGDPRNAVAPLVLRVPRVSRVPRVPRISRVSFVYTDDSHSKILLQNQQLCFF